MLTRYSVLLLIALLSLVAPLSPGLATDYDVVNEDIWPSQNDVAQTAGNGKKLLENQWQEAIVAITESNYIYSGCALPASSGSLNISVPACQALINGRFVDIPGSTTITATASTTNHVYLKFVRDGASLATGAKFEVNTTGTAPADSVKIGQMVASGSAITSTTDQRRLGMPAPYRGPWAVGSGSTRTHEGSVTISSNQNLSGIHFYTDFTLNSGVTLTVPAGQRRLIIVASGTITINGTITAAGAGGSGGSGGPVGGVGSPGSDGTDQPGGNGGSPNSLPAGGRALLNGAVVASAGTQVTGSALAIDLYAASAMGGAGGAGGDGGAATSSGATGGPGGGSIALIAPSVVLGAPAVLNTSGSAGAAAPGDAQASGGGGAGNVYVQARNYTDNGATFTLTGGANGAAHANGAGMNGVKQILLY